MSVLNPDMPEAQILWLFPSVVRPKIHGAMCGNPGYEGVANASVTHIHGKLFRMGLARASKQRVLPCKEPYLPPLRSAGRTPSPAPPTPWWPCTFCSFGLDQPLLSTTCPSLHLMKCPRRNSIPKTLRSWTLSVAPGDDHGLWIHLPAPVCELPASRAGHDWRPSLSL